MRISLVTSTMNRPRQIGELLACLAAQTIKCDEIVIVDQSGDEATGKVVSFYQDQLPITYLRDLRKGLSRGRNLGLRHVTGDVVAFPDDDCIYPTDTLAKVTSALASDPTLGIFTGMSITPAGVPSQGRWGQTPHIIDRSNLWTSQTSYTTFYRASALQKAGDFNEDLGVGSGTKWGSGEETELLIRALKAGAKGLYDPSLKIIHPEPLAVFDAAALDRGKRYNRGFGRVMRLGQYSNRFAIYMISRPLLGIFTAALKGNVGLAKYRFIAARERLAGWRDPT